MMSEVKELQVKFKNKDEFMKMVEDAKKAIMTLADAKEIKWVGLGFYFLIDGEILEKVHWLG